MIDWKEELIKKLLNTGIDPAILRDWGEGVGFDYKDYRELRKFLEKKYGEKFHGVDLGLIRNGC